MNETIIKFRYPALCVSEYPSWVVLLREKQITAGCLILACKEKAAAFPQISTAAFLELKNVVSDIELNLKNIVQFEKINYVALMMVDPHFHFHVIPRYTGNRIIAGTEISDSGWPKHPDFQAISPFDQNELITISDDFRNRWIKSDA